MGTRISRILRHLPAAGIVAVALILGLLGMHGLNLHGTASEHMTGSVAIVAVDATEHAHSAHFDTSLRDYSASETSLRDYSVSETSLRNYSASDTTLRNHSASDDAQHMGMAMTCALVLLLFFVLAAPRGMLSRVSRSHTASVSKISPPPLALSRAPSLHVLCISRT